MRCLPSLSFVRTYVSQAGSIPLERNLNKRRSRWPDAL
jgi:hypothetical protein